MRDRIDADMDIIINELIDGESFMIRRGINAKREKIIYVAKRILAPVYADAEKYRQLQRAQNEQQRYENLKRGM